MKPKPVSRSAAAGLCLLLLAGLACRRGPKDEELVRSVYHDYRAALREADLARIGSLVSAGRREELAGAEAAAKLQLVLLFMPAEVRVLKATVTGDEARLEAEGDKEGQRMTGTVRLVREGRAWKVDKEDWSMRIELSGLGDVGRPEDTGPLLPDPQRPPQAHAVLEGHQGEVSRLAWTRDGRVLVSASYGDYSVRTWRADTGAALSVARSESRVTDLAVAPDGRAILTADVHGNVSLWPLEGGTIASPQRLLSEAGSVLAVSPDGKQVATAGYRAPVKIWSLPEGTPLQELAGAPNQRALALLGGDVLVSAGEGNTYSHWSRAPRLFGLAGEGWRERRRTISRVSKDAGVSSLDVSGDGRLLVTGHNDSSIVAFDLAAGRELFNVFVRDAATRDVAVSPDGTLLATAQQDGAVYLWDPRSGRQLAALREHRDAPASVAFSPDGKTLASGGDDRRIVLWRGGPPRAPLAAPEAPPEAATALDTGAFEPGPVEDGGRRNYVKDPYAYRCAGDWRRKGEASCETSADGRPHFALRYGGHFWQDVPIPASAGRYALLIARAASERVNADGDQTGRPYLYGSMVNSRDPYRFNAHLSGQQMLLEASGAEEWGTVWGVFEVPPETGAIRIFLQQADGGQPQNGSAARFDDVGVFLFDTEREAAAFAQAYGR